MDRDVGAALGELANRLGDVGGVEALWVGGSLATGDHVRGVSDLDLVALTSQRFTGDALLEVVRVHEDLDAGVAKGMDLGCQYVDAARLRDVEEKHPTWTHGALADRSVSLVTRAELVLHGFAVFGQAPHEVLPAVAPDQVRTAARAELAGYWSYAARRPWMFVRLPVMVDLGLTAMARARHAVITGQLMTKSQAIEQVRAPQWLREHLRMRRRGLAATSPRGHAAFLAWRDVARTTRAHRAATRKISPTSDRAQG